MGHVARRVIINAYKMIVIACNFNRKRELEKSGHRCVDNIRTALRRTEFEGLGWIKLVQVRV